MQSGKVVERGLVEEIFHQPKEEYTKLLVEAIPRCERGKSMRERL